MKFEMKFDEEKNRFSIKTFGNLSLLGLEDMVRQLVTNPGWQKGRDLLIDHREASFSEISVEDIIELSKMVTVLDETLGARHCSVINSDDGHLKNAMYKHNIDPVTSLVTRNFLSTQYDEAIAWLDEKA